MADLAISPLRFSGATARDMVIEAYGPRQTLSVGATATASGDRPVMPAGFTHVLLSASKGVIVDIGEDPTASASSGVDISAGGQLVLPIGEGLLISAIEA